MLNDLLKSNRKLVAESVLEEKKPNSQRLTKKLLLENWLESDK